jgi:hypothetical protein
MAKKSPKSGANKRAAAPDPMTAVLATYRAPQAADFGDAWAGIEPTFSNAKAVRKWAEMSATTEGEDLYFKDPWMLKTEKKIGKKIAERYAALRADGRAYAMFDRVERDTDQDPWGTKRQNLHFRWREKGFEDFEVKLSIDPEIFEYSVKPIHHVVPGNRFVGSCKSSSERALRLRANSDDRPGRRQFSLSEPSSPAACSPTTSPRA